MKENSSFNGLKPEGMFKIEGRNPLYGERILWENRFYRFKHVISGKYLSIKSDDKLHLVRELDNSSLFSLHPIKFLKSEKLLRYVKKDSYFKIKNFHGKWFRFPISEMEGAQTGSELDINSQRGKNSPTAGIKNSNSLMTTPKNSRNSKKNKFVLQYSTQMDTLKVSKANFEEVWQSNFLLACGPILIEGLLAITKIN